MRNLIELDYQQFDKEAIRALIRFLSEKTKKLNDNGYMVFKYDPKSIYYNDETRSFEFAYQDKISPLYANSKEEAIMYDIQQLANFAFCSYLPGYNFEHGLFNPEVLSEKFDTISNVFEEEDRDYFKSVLVDSKVTGQLPDPIYYHEYIDKKQSLDSSSRGTHKGLYTPAGKFLTEDDSSSKEAAFGDMFFFATITASMLIGIGSLLIFFLK